MGLIGPNGCGKSTQLLMLMQEIEPGSGRTPTSIFHFCVFRLLKKSKSHILTLGSHHLGYASSNSVRILKFPEDMKIAYMQQEADLDNSRTAFEELLVCRFPNPSFAVT